MATDDAEVPEDERDIELLSISAIFPELEVEVPAGDARRATLEVEVNLDTPVKASFAPPVAIEATSTATYPGTAKEYAQNAEASPRMHTASVDPGHGSVSLSSLPSLKCHIVLSSTYPTTASPVVTLSCDTPWTPDSTLRELEQQVAVLWEENGRNVVLYDYLDWLSQAARDGFHLVKAPDETLFLPRDLEVPLLDFDLQAKRRKFASGTFNCGVCLEPKKGSVCHKMSQCGHVFCVECLQDFYNNCIIEGHVSNVKCLEPGCERDQLQMIPEKRRKRADFTIKPSELAEIPLDQDKIQRFVKLKRKNELETNRNVVFCPRRWCQGAARSEKKKKSLDDPDTESDEESKDATKTDRFGDRLAICSECGFAFCNRCLKGPWHGEHVACRPPRTTEELSAEERATEAYMTAHTARCPTCDAPVQKTMGCNHMSCQLCKTHFCYLCQAYLMERNPYAHFNTPGRGCYLRLWVLEGGDDGAAQLAENVPDDVFDEEPPPAAAENRIPAAPMPPAAPIPPRGAPANDNFIQFVADSSSEEDEVAPPPVPNPPRGRRERGRGRGRGRGGPVVRGGGPPRGGGARGGAAARRGQQGRVAEPVGGQIPAPAADQALRRFIQMALQDREDGWDSDELDSDGDDDWEIPVRGRVP